MTMKKYDIIIIGGGVSGLIAANAAKSKSVLILEASPRVGKKLLATGNGKCNLLNKNLSADYYNAPDFVLPVFNRYNEKSLENFYDDLGLAIRFDSEGRGYPVSECAATVLDILRRAVSNKGVDIITECRVTGVEKKDCFVISASCGEYFADKVLFAAGSDAGFGIDSLDILDRIAANRPFRAALAPLSTDTAPIKGLNGVRVKCAASLITGGEYVRTEYGEVLFKSFGLSGIAVFNLSSLYVRAGAPENSYISLNLLEQSYKKVLETLIHKAEKFKTADELLGGIFHKMVNACILNYAGVGAREKCGENDLKKIAAAIVNYRIRIKGVADKSLAQVMCGGINLDGINKNTLESKSVKGLYFSGEAVDIDGLSGGYNLMWAAASALTAAENF